MPKQVTFCYNCGTKIEAGEDYCRSCGRRSGQLDDSMLPDITLKGISPGTMPQRNQDTSDYGQDSGLSGPPSFSTGADADVDPTPTLYTPGPRFYSQDPSSSYGGAASGSFSGGADSYWGSQNSYQPGAEAHTPRADSYQPNSYASQQSPGRSNKSSLGLALALFLVTLIGIVLGLWLSGAI